MASNQLQTLLTDILRNTFGHANYRNVEQKEAVETLIREQIDVFVCMPTGLLC